MEKFKFPLCSALMLSAALVTHGGTPPTPITASQVITIPGRYVLANGQFAVPVVAFFI